MSELTIVLKVAIEPSEAGGREPTVRAEVVPFDTEDDGQERSAVVLLRIG